MLATQKFFLKGFMTLQEQLMDDMKQAMRDKDTVKLGVIRLIRSEVRNYEIDNGPQDDAGVQAIIRRMTKQLKDALTDFKNADRDDLVQEEAAKIVVLESYLPAQMSEAEVAELVNKAIADLPDKNMGAAMKAAMAAVNGQADGKVVSELVKQALAS
jgi:uncharacterized protein